MPGTTWPETGTPARPSPALRRIAAVSMSSERMPMLQQRFGVFSFFKSPPDASWAPFPHRSPRQSSANAAWGGLKPPPNRRLRRANLHLLQNIESRQSLLHLRLRSSFVAHMVIVVDAGLAGIEVWRWYPFGAAVFAFSGPPAAGFDAAVVRRPQARDSSVMSVCSAVGPVGRRMVDLAVVGRCGAAGEGAATVFGVQHDSLRGRGESSAAARDTAGTRCGRRTPPDSGGPPRLGGSPPTSAAGCRRP